MSTGNEREALIRVADRLCVELGRAGSGEASTDGRLLDGSSGGAAGILGQEDEQLVATMRRGLAGIADVVGLAKYEGTPQHDAVCAALDGAELVLRGELVRGDTTQLPLLMPSFVFLVTLPIVEQDVALALSRRTSELVSETLCTNDLRTLDGCEPDCQDQARPSRDSRSDSG